MSLTLEQQDRVKQLREELNTLGYHVIAKDWVRKFSVQRIISAQDWHEAPENIRLRMEQHTRQDMGRHLGQGILESGATNFGHEYVVDIGRVYRVTTQIILRDPQFDKPEWFPNRRKP